MLELRDLSKDYYVNKKSVNALININLFFPKSEFCAILGPSGCGKTTLLNIIGGLDKATSGDLIIEGVSTSTYKDIDWDNYRNKRIGFVFQTYNLINHLSILTNVELSLTIQGISKKERKRRAKEALDNVGLKGLYRKKPTQLSGGQMQRVAIARAIVNNPDIILADEPTGALDSKTSIQVMDILKEISKEKLVIMVTHNSVLAEKYADRIIEFEDGKVINDSLNNEPERKAEEDKTYYEMKSLQIIDEKEKKKHIKIKKKDKSKLSFWSALKLAFANMWNKKGRTILTSLGSSFGIIGVALVLALSNGFSGYVSKIETETASTLPINVPAYSITSSSTTVSNYNVTDRWTDSEEVYPYIAATSSTSYEYKYNNFNNKYFAYLDYLKNDVGILNDYLVNYNDDYQFHLVTEFPESLDGEIAATVNEVDTGYSASTSTVSSVISSVTGLPTTIFHTLYGEEEYIMQNYDLIEGRYPEEENELVLVVDSYNRVTFNTLKQLGFYSLSDTTSDYIELLDENGESVVEGFSFDDILGKKYKIFNNDEFYTQATLRNNSTQEEVGYVYVENDLDELFNDENLGIEMEIVGILRQSQDSSISLMPEGLCYLPSFQQTIIDRNADSLVSQYYYKNINLKDDYEMSDFLNALIDTFESGDISSSTVNNLFNSYFTTYSFFPSGDYGVSVTISTYLTYCKYFAIDLIPESLKTKLVSTSDDSVSYFIYYIVSKILLADNEDDQMKALIGLMGFFSNYSDIADIIIFPKDITSKDTLLEYLDEYNDISAATGPNDPLHATSTAEQIYYTDIVGTVTSTLAQVINVITIVLVILASVSLIVSCVMTALITYASVIERTREIGILRAIGSRKGDISMMFESESSLIGLIAGIVGCLVAYIITIPINIWINNLYPSYNIGSIASLNWQIVLILIAISFALAFISGFIPSRYAARKKPVEALRND